MYNIEKPLRFLNTNNYKLEKPNLKKGSNLQWQ